MKNGARSSALLLVGLGFVVSPLFAGCGGDETSSTGGGGTTTTTEGGGGTTSQGGGGNGGNGGTGGNGGSTTGGGGTGGATTTSQGGGGAGGGGGLPTGDHDCSPADGSDPGLTLTEIAGGLESPVLVRSAPGDNTRLFIVEKSGRIRIVKDGTLLDEPFLDISDRVRNAGERGLLGLAFHPKYQENGRFFVFYTDENNQGGSQGDQNVAEYARSDNPDLAVAQADGFGQEVQNLLHLFDDEGNHNGGMLEFSPVDGYLYIGLGDGGGGGDNHGPFGNGLNLGTLWGKIARIDVDAKEDGKNYAIPPGNMTTIPAMNPSTGEVLPEIWDYGLRNPWRFSFDPCSGDLYMGDVGQGSWEEINVEPAGMGNNNYGWKAYEGTHVYNQDLADMMEANVLPVVEYSHIDGGCSVTGGYVYRGSAIPGLRGRYFYGDYCSARVWSFVWDGTGQMQDVTEHTAQLGNLGAITSFGQDNQGNLYIMDFGGTVSRIDAL